ncbi:JAB domain-containing protein [Pseudomonas sp. Irchel 3A5]|uniref:JAB domain-containing protein n=1 Tax=Pseudomonas sp. Irchel 3A5 TaxID=2008911 RepID=UPI000BA2D149|nr:JAB domain-containing protein [Pseudomonas sp. Irchel 3A5]
MKLALIDKTISELEASITTAEDELIQEVLLILDRRLFSTEAALESPCAVASYLKLKLAAEKHEAFGVVFLNAKHQPLAFEILFRGSIDCAAIYPRQVVKRALAHNAAAVIISHNHPSGCTKPSSADITLTTRMKDALSLVDVRLVDHFIVGSGKPLSFAERGLI